MSQKIAEFKFTKNELAVLEKFSNINDRIFISPDRFQIIDGQINPNGASNNRFSGGNRIALYRFENGYNFIDDIGICNLPTFLKILKSFKDDYIIEIYERSMIIKDDITSIEFFLTPAEVNLIPKTDAERPVEKMGLAQNKIEFKLTWSILEKIFKMQDLLNTNNIHFFVDSKNQLTVKIAENFDTGGNNSATIVIPKNQIIVNNLSAITEGRYNKFESLKSNYIISDDYTVVLTERGMMLSGDAENTNYIIKAFFLEPTTK